MTDDADRLPEADLPPRFRLAIVRHAQTAANLDGTYCGTRDPGLTPLGRQMAGFLPRNSLLAGLTGIVSSPMLRARETAAPLGQALGVSRIPTDARLGELDFGTWEGSLPRRLRDDAGHRHWQENPYHNAPPGGETGAQVLRRVLTVLAKELVRTPALAVVTHKSPARLLASFFLNSPPAGFRSLAGFWVTSVTRIEVDPDLPPRVLGPSIDHLPQAWRTRPDRFNPTQSREIAPNDRAF